MASSSCLVVADCSMMDATLRSVTAALRLSPFSTTVLATSEGSAALLSRVPGVSRVLLASGALYSTQCSPEALCSFVARLLQHGDPQNRSFTHVIAPATALGKALIPRLGGVIGCASVSDVVRIDAADTFARPVFSGSHIATVKLSGRHILATVRPSAFSLQGTSATPVPIEGIKFAEELAKELVDGGRVPKRVSFTPANEGGGRPQLSSAKVVVCGGRGMKTKEGFGALFQLADSIDGAAVGASRSAVDSGLCSHDIQIGQTGQSVAPDLYVAVGVSGAVQHTAGMKDSKVVVSINTDESSQMVSDSDYSLIADAATAVPALTALLTKKPK